MLPTHQLYDVHEPLPDSHEAAQPIVAHFDGLGAVAVDLDERTMTDLCNREEILEVIEDTTVRPIKFTNIGDSLGAQTRTEPPRVRTEMSSTSPTRAGSKGTLDSRQCRLPWNIVMTGAPRLWERATGAGVKVALLDSGIAADHPDVPVAGGVSLVPKVASWTDDNGHGTHCAGIIGARNFATGCVGVAPGCDPYAVKVLSAAGRGTLTAILAGLLWCAEKEMDVVSVSVGSQATRNESGLSVYERAVDCCIGAGCVVLAPAGNTGNTPSPWVQQPARCANVIAVGASDRHGKPAGFSCRGPRHLPRGSDVELFAPGVGVRSTLPDGRAWNLSGTSMACAHAAGVAALLREAYPDASPWQLRNLLAGTLAPARRHVEARATGV